MRNSPLVAAIPRLRVALYSHDTQGLGHIRRNSLIAKVLVEADPRLDVLLLTGAREAAALPLPARTDLVVVPAIHKDPVLGYGARRWPVALHEVVKVRSAVLSAALQQYAPDALIVDKVADGVAGELLPALTWLADRGGCATVLGLRDVLDAPGPARREWEAAGTTELVEQYFDAVWVYGDQRVYDPITEYGLPASIRHLAAFTGYLGTGRAFEPEAQGGRREPYVLCLVGGGQDGLALAAAFARARLPRHHHGIVVAGPYMPAPDRALVAELVGPRRDLSLVTLAHDVVGLIGGAAAAITMGGYNSICEVLAASVPALVVPRSRPRAEQVVRARRLVELGLVDLVDEPVTPGALTAWMRRAVHRSGQVPARDVIDLDGLARVPMLLHALLDSSALHPKTVGGTSHVPV